MCAEAVADPESPDTSDHLDGLGNKVRPSRAVARCADFCAFAFEWGGGEACESIESSSKHRQTPDLASCAVPVLLHHFSCQPTH